MKRYELPPLPYSYNALEPVISEEIMRIHHDKHHAAYVNKANEALEKLRKYRGGELELDVKAVLRDLSFNFNGHLLHDLFWRNMEPPSEDNKPGGVIRDKIDEAFGGFDAFRREFSVAANTVEGSGWAVLVYEPLLGELMVTQIEKHNLGHLGSTYILLVLDVWEHAYYLQYRNDRAGFVENWWRVVNWDDVDRRLQKVI